MELIAVVGALCCGLLGIVVLVGGLLMLSRRGAKKRMAALASKAKAEAVTLGFKSHPADKEGRVWLSGEIDGCEMAFCRALRFVKSDEATVGSSAKNYEIVRVVFPSVIGELSTPEELNVKGDYWKWSSKTAVGRYRPACFADRGPVWIFERLDGDVDVAELLRQVSALVKASAG